MCGIFGIYGAPKTTDHDKFLREAMLCGTVRGAHGAGALKVVIDRKEKLTYSTAYKVGGDGSTFLADSKARQLLITSSDVMAVVGHNRYAIGSAVNENNAHPFWRGPVTLVHNGVVDNQYELLNAYGTTSHQAKPRVEVDSDSIALALSLSSSTTEVLEKLEGAYALVWHDARNNSLNFARNDERPMFFGIAGDVTVFASERGMLEWLAGRNNIKISEVRELPVGIMYSVMYDPDNNKLIGRSTEFKAQARKKWDYTAYSGYNRGASSTSGTHATSYRHETSPKSGLVNLDEDSYGDLVKYVQGMCAADGIIVGKPQDWLVTELDVGDTRSVLRLINHDYDSVQASKYLYTNTGASTVEARIQSAVDAALLKLLEEKKNEYVIVTAAPKAVVITDNEWPTKTSEEVYKAGGWRFLLDHETITVSELSANGSYVELYNSATAAQEAYQEINKGRARLIRGRMYKIINQTAGALRDVYKGCDVVVFERHAAQVGMAVISPLNLKNVTVMVPESNLQEIPQ